MAVQDDAECRSFRECWLVMLVCVRMEVGYLSRTNAGRPQWLSVHNCIGLDRRNVLWPYIYIVSRLTGIMAGRGLCVADGGELATGS